MATQSLTYKLFPECHVLSGLGALPMLLCHLETPGLYWKRERKTWEDGWDWRSGPRKTTCFPNSDADYNCCFLDRREINEDPHDEKRPFFRVYNLSLIRDLKKIPCWQNSTGKKWMWFGPVVFVHLLYGRHWLLMSKPWDQGTLRRPWGDQPSTSVYRWLKNIGRED